MYQVLKNNRVTLKNQMFESYEKARQALRKHLRKLVRAGRMDKTTFDGSWKDAGQGMEARAAWDHISRNPVNYTNAGYRIAKV